MLTGVQHLEQVEPWEEQLSLKLQQVSSIQRHRKYLLCLQHIEELRYCSDKPMSLKPTVKRVFGPVMEPAVLCCCCSGAVQQCVMTSSVWEAISAINSMAALHTGIQQSGCSHLQAFLRDTLTFWHKIVKERLTRWARPRPPAGSKVTPSQ